MNWGKVQNVGVRVLVPLVTAIITYVVATANANREFKAKMIEDAIRVLAAPVCDSTRTLQQWAATVLARYSEVPFSVGAESMLVRVGPVLFAEVVGRRFSRLLVCDSVGHNCRPMVMEKPLPITDVPGPARLLLWPTTVTVEPKQQVQFTVIGVTSAGDTALIPDLTWTASGGSIADTFTVGGHHNARFMAGTATGDFLIVARSASARLADSAHVHVQAQ